MTAGGFAIGVIMVVTDSKAAMYCFFGWLVLCSIYLHQIRCPRCGTPVGTQGKAGSIPLLGAIPRTKCSHCSADLTQPEG